MRYEYPPLEKVRYCKVCRGPIPVHREDSEFCSTNCLITDLEEKDKEAKLGEDQPITDDPPPFELQRDFQPITEGSVLIKTGPDCEWTGMHVIGAEWSSEFWSITCPCGVVVKYGINEIPEVDTPHPCGNPDHWTVRFSEP